MPLLRKEPFEKAPVPVGLKPSDEVFFVPLTGEIFTDYDEFFKRTILLNSLVWTCGATGRSGLTFEEALNSERSAQDSVEIFPDNLERPLLFLISMTCRGRIDDLVFDVWSFCKERYLVNEIVEVCYNGSKCFAQILAAKYVGSDNSMLNDSQSSPAREGKTHESSLGDDQDEVYASGRRKPKADYRAPPASDFIYEVAILPKQDIDEVVAAGPDSPLILSCPKADLSPQEILRRRHLFTKQKCRLFVKTICEPLGGFWGVRESSVQEHGLGEMEWSKDVFDGPMPIFRRTPASRRSVLASAHSREEFSQPPSNSRRHQLSSGPSTKSKHSKSRFSSPAAVSEQELKMRPFVEKQEMALASLIDECNRFNIVGGGKRLTLDDFPLDPIDVDLNEQILAELRERTKKAKDEEKERHREFKRREKEALIEWRKPRDDLLCDDHQPLPELPTIRCPPFLPVDCFGDVLALLEFLASFGEEINLKEHFPVASDGGVRVTLSMLYNALKTQDTDHIDVGDDDSSAEKDKDNQSGPSILIKLFKALLAQVFRRLMEEDGDEANLDNREELQHENCDLDHPYYGKVIEEATRASEHVRNTYGLSIRNLPLDNFTITELLRIHLVASGYYPGSNPGRFRYQSRGGYRCWDDPGMTFRSTNPDLMDRLRHYSIFELGPVDRLKLLTVLSNQLLTFSTMRFPLQQKTERLQALRYEIRQLQLNDQKQDREALTAKICKQEVRAAAVLENGESSDGQKYDPEKPSPFVQRLRKFLPKSLPKNEKGEAKGEITWESIEAGNQDKIKALISEVNYDNVALEEVDDVREVQRQIFFHDERRLVEEIYHLQTACGMVILGRDRAYAKYSLLASLGAVVVERYDRTIGECTDKDGTPIARIDGFDAIKFDPRLILFTKTKLKVCTGRPQTCPVHGADWTNDEFCLLHNKETLDQLTSSLNRRGFRESELLENFEFFRPFIERAFSQCPVDLLLNPVDDGAGKEDGEHVATYFESNLKESMLDFEERLSSGNFGGLRGRARENWRQAIEKNTVVAVHPEVEKTDAVKNFEVVPANRSEIALKVRAYSKHFSELASAIHVKAYRKSFVEPHGRYVEGEFIETGTNSLDLWKTALLEATSFAQLHLHVATLDTNIAWSKSTTQMRCRLCRRKGDVQTFLECDICERLYHSDCVKPPASSVPAPITNRWCCSDCTPKNLPQQQKSSSRKGQNDEDEDVGDENEDDDYCEGCQNPLKGAKRRFVCSSCSAVYHPSCAVPSGSSKWTKADMKKWKCENCADDETSTPAGGDSDSVASLSRQRSSLLNDSDAGSEGGHSSAFLDHRQVSMRLSKAAAASVTSTRTGRVVKKPKTFEEQDGESIAKKKSMNTSNGDLSPSAAKATLPAAPTAIPRTPVANGSKADNWQAAAMHVLQTLSSHPDGWPFLKPVTKKIAPDYFSVIKSPMDFGTVRTKLYKNAYSNAEEFVADLKLVFENCRTYNGPVAPVYQCGVRLETAMWELVADVLPFLSKRTPSRKQSVDNGGTLENLSNGDSVHDTRKKVKRVFSSFPSDGTIG